jgi:hypothetical protein
MLMAILVIIIVIVVIMIMIIVIIIITATITIMGRPLKRCLVTPVTGLNRPNTGKEDDDATITATMHRCQANFSAMVFIQCRARNRLDLSHDKRRALAVTKPT